MKRILLFVCILGLLYVPTACFRNSCNGIDLSQYRNFEIKQLAQTVKFQTDSIIDTTQVYDYRSIHFEIMIAEFVQIGALKTQDLQSNALFACDPNVPHSVHNIQSIAILAEKPIVINGNLYEAGDTLNSLFRIPSTYSGGLTRISEFVIAKEAFYEFTRLQFYLEEKPDAASELRVSIHIEFSDSKRFDLDPISVKIQ